MTVEELTGCTCAEVVALPGPGQLVALIVPRVHAAGCPLAHEVALVDDLDLELEVPVPPPARPPRGRRRPRGGGEPADPFDAELARLGRRPA